MFPSIFYPWAFASCTLAAYYSEAARTLCCWQGKSMFRRRRRKGIGMGGMAVILLLSGGGGTAAGWSVQAAYVEQFGFGASTSSAVVMRQPHPLDVPIDRKSTRLN